MTQLTTKKNIKFYGTIDRIEGNVAIILVGENPDSIEIPKDLLPVNCKEGDMIFFKLEIKDKKTRAEKEKIKTLIKKLSGTCD
ncbi:MAG: DUF3006 domain-containing protein [bacterium]